MPAAKGAACGCRASRKIRAIRARIPEAERYYFLEERYPKYGNLVPRDIATREIFNVCINEGLSVEQDRLCVYLDLTHIPRDVLDRKLGGILEIYEKFQGVDPRDVPMKIFPAVHYSMGGLWVDYERTAAGGLNSARREISRRTFPACTPSASATTSITARIAWAPTRCLSCIFSGLIVAPGVETLLKARSKVAVPPISQPRLFEQARTREQEAHDTLLAPIGWRREPVPAAPGTGRRDDQGRHRGAVQRSAR